MLNFKEYKQFLISVMLVIIMLILVKIKIGILLKIFVLIAVLGILNPLYIIPVFFVSSLSSNYFMIQDGLGIGRIFSICLTLNFVLNLLKNKRLRNKKYIFFILFIWVSFYCSYLKGDYYDSLIFIGASLNFVIFLSFNQLKINELKFKILIRSIFYSFCILSIFLLEESIFNSRLLSGRLTAATNLNTNAYAMLIVQLNAFFYGYFFYSQKNKEKLLLLMLSATNLSLLMLSGSRSGAIASIFGLIIIIFIKNKINIKKIMRVLSLLIGLLFILNKLIQKNQIIKNRMNLNEVISSGGTHRLPRIINELKYVVPNNFLLGVGPSAVNERLALGPYMSMPGSSHNIIISCLTQLGLIGLIGHLLLYFNLLRDLFKIRRLSDAWIIPFSMIFSAIINGIGEVVFTERLFWCAMSLGVLVINNFKKYDKGD